MAVSDDSPVPTYADLARLDGRNYVVVGAGQGMGRQTCHALAQAGAGHVICVDIDDERARSVAAEIGVGIPFVADVTEREPVTALARFAAEELGRLDGLVDIVGMARWAGILDIDDENWEFSHAMNLRHAFYCSQELGRLMVAGGGGVMTFIASVSGATAAPMHAAYGAFKAALMAWVQSLAVELGPFGVRANAVSPGGVILTPRIVAALSAEQQAANTANVPLGRMGLPSNIASVVLFLTSDMAAYVSGQTLTVDGAVSAKFPYPTTL